MYSKILYILNVRAIANVDLAKDFALEASSDGQGVRIANWDEFKLGICPTSQELIDLDTNPAFATYQINVAWNDARAKRDNLLAACDWTQLGDTQLAPTVQAKWLNYRQALRDITIQADPNNITWPSPPV